jgi:acetyltransferase-like isoleucine patch superfamily enzyme
MDGSRRLLEQPIRGERLALQSDHALLASNEAGADAAMETGNGRIVREDPLNWISWAATKLNTVWLKRTYRFAGFGRNVAVHYSCDILRSMSPHISFGDKIYVAPDVWMNVAPGSLGAEPKIMIGSGCRIGRRATISARNRIILEADVLLAPSVLIMDHNHEFSDPEKPIHAQGVTSGGRIFIERNCWLGHGAAILCGSRDLTLGRNSIVGANAVVTKSFPPFSIIAGNPATLIRTYSRGTTSDQSTPGS